ARLQRVGDARHGSGELAARHLRYAHYGLYAGSDAEGFILRHVKLDADRVAVHQGKQERAARRVRLYQTADIDVALGDDAVKRGDHALVGLLLVQHAQLRVLRGDIRLSDRDSSGPRLESQAIGVALLQGNPAFLNKRIVAIPRDLGKVASGFCLIKR